MSVTDITSNKWRGERAAPIDPAAMRFAAREAELRDSCCGCIFRTSGSAICFRAARIARFIGQPDCDDATPSGSRYIYILDESDPRQLPLVGVEAC